jgi:hypothetical protein
MKNNLPERKETKSEIVLYQTEDGKNRIAVRLEDDTIWLTQQCMAELLQTTRQSISHHLQSIFAEGELSRDATVKQYSTVQREGGRDVNRLLDHYNLEVIVSVGYRVKSHAATRFRIWATQRLARKLRGGGASSDDQKDTGRARRGGHERQFRYDCFICHASEDKRRFVDDLAHGLRGKRYRVWYDKFELKVGDSLRRKIEEGLRDSRHGIVVLSPDFFAKPWPQKELDALAMRTEDRTILPVWLDIDEDGVSKYSPLLAGTFAAKASDGLPKVLKQLCDAVNVSGH